MKFLSLQTATRFALTLLFITLFSCEKESVTRTNEIPKSFLGSYRGDVQFSSDTGIDVSNQQGIITIKERVNDFAIIFSDGIPMLDDLHFYKEDGQIQLEDIPQSITVLRIQEGLIELEIILAGNHWSFDGEKM